MSLHPVRDEAEARRIREAIELCGKNRGPHDYIPIEWFYTQGEKGIQYKRISKFICRVCFCNVSASTLVKMYKNVSVDIAQNHDTF